jgi:RNA polymerase sigma-70 factor (ECF subfamily)
MRQTSDVTDAARGDRQLVDAVMGGDTAAFRLLVEREEAPVIAICRRILGNEAEAEDVAQEAFLRAYRSLATYRADGPFAAWIARIAARQAVQRLVKRQPALELDETSGAAVASVTGDEPEASALAGEQRAAVRQAVAALPRTQRDVIALRFFSELSLEEIAQTTGTPVGTVKSRLHRGLASLRESMPSRSEQ